MIYSVAVDSTHGREVSIPVSIVPISFLQPFCVIIRPNAILKRPKTMYTERYAIKVNFEYEIDRCFVEVSLTMAVVLLTRSYGK